MFISPMCSFFVDRDHHPYFVWFIYFRVFFINMHYGHIASDKEASICEKSVLFFVIRILIIHTKRRFHSAI